MYTQCPDCSTAFRVTADVLKQAAGKVRCGGCGNAFNALEYLSESMPEQPAPREADEALPELKPEPLQSSDGLPASISAEQSAALLKTLDELAGSDIRIEDTGVEWRVLDDEAINDEPVAQEAVNDEPAVDELLEESPTPVDQFLTETPAVVESPEIFEGEADEPEHTPVEELRFDDNTPLPEDFGLDDESMDAVPYDTAPAVHDDSEPEPDTESEPVPEPQADPDLSEPDEWTDILGEFEDLAEAVATPLEAEAEALEESDAEIEEESDAEAEGRPLDVDSQFALQAEAMGIDLSGIHEAPETGTEEELEAADEELEEEIEEEPEEEVEIDLEDDPEEDLEEDVEIDLEDEPEEELEDELEDETSGGLDVDLEAELEQLDLISKEEHDDEDDKEDHYVPPMTEEEQTINMQIDQDLFALAIEDEDGFSSTIIIPDDAAEDMLQEEQAKNEEPDDDKEEHPFKDTGAGFETIVMEGEFTRSALDKDKLAADAAAAAALSGAAAAERESEKAARKSPLNYKMIGGVAVLILLLVVQALHQSREALATNPAFNSVVGPMYRAIGKPLSPEWDITGWRFEATKGSTDESDENLTIYSRIGNKSDKPLPYPLVGISLTDRFEETIGSRILDPAEYLSNDLDPRKLVEPGNTFNAVITIDSPAEDATGFKLNVCYRESGGQLRCAIEDFK